MSRRFFIEQPLVSEEVILQGAEAHHLLHVMRAKVGDSVVLFDGTGYEYEATIAKAGRKQIELRVTLRQQVDRELPYGVALTVALPRGDRQDWLVQKAVELGVTRLIPWQAERSVAKPNDKTLQRLRRVVIEASKQCGRNLLMEIDSPVETPEALKPQHDVASLLAHVPKPGRDAPSVTEALCALPTAGVRIAIGPEGGLADAEVELAMANDWRLVGLGPRVLRTETAALAVVAQVTLAARSP